MGLKLANIFSQDLDDLFAYNTRICIILQSRGIGIMYRLCQLLAVIYITAIVYFFEEGYFVSENTDGISIIHTSAAGQSVINSDSQGIWDALDIEGSHLEGNSLFVATKTVQHFGQTKGICQDFYRSCIDDDDCYTFINETCNNGRCFGPNWCNPEGQATIAEYDDSLDHFLIWIRGHVSFTEKEEEAIYSTFDDKKSIRYPQSEANTFSLKDLLEMGGIAYREIKEQGAEIRGLYLNVVWKCMLGMTCHPKLGVRRVDKFSDNDFLGAFMVKYYYFLQGQNIQRHIFNMTGVKFYFDTKAKGSSFSTERLLLQVATLFSIWRVIDMLLDGIIVMLPGNDEYKKLKYVPVREEVEEEEVLVDENAGKPQRVSEGEEDENQNLVSHEDDGSQKIIDEGEIDEEDD